jgi:hypothetical protein
METAGIFGPLERIVLHEGTVSENLQQPNVVKVKEARVARSGMLRAICVYRGPYSAGIATGRKENGNSSRLLND